MSAPRLPFVDVRASLVDLVGEAYIDAACAARARLTGEDAGALKAMAAEPVEFFPAELQGRLAELLPLTGEQVCGGLQHSVAGANSRAFTLASHHEMAPLSGLGYYRVGEDGRLFIISKSEHYHAPLGHAFPGYQLIERAKKLGIPNATHNNTRGHITRLLEEHMVAAANGMRPDDPALARLIEDDCSTRINRVFNLETGSLAAEAALKLALARFYTPQQSGEPPYAGRTPVVLVLGNDDGGFEANYHGTVMMEQMLRGMWPGMYAAMEQAGILRVHAIRPNNFKELEEAFQRFEQAPFKIAALFHEIIMMNYAGRLLTKEFLGRAYELCHRHDVPTVCDEIQSCMWAPGLFQFREHGLQPTVAVVGKGFPGGEYPASRVLFAASLDSLPQFGALVTNGQEELASLAYLITMRWGLTNAELVQRIGDDYEARLREFAARYPEQIQCVDGRRHLCTICFHDLEQAKHFVAYLTNRGFDTSAQTYKATCPPAVMLKPPIIIGPEAVEFIAGKLEEAMQAVLGARV
ncbi:MAG: aminotransferase class III-fold pyridoxal phosphate-dependent enzyme [Armatimonadota bacterium]